MYISKKNAIHKIMKQLSTTGFPRSWKNLENSGKENSWKVMENLLKIESREIVLRAERKIFFRLLVILVAVTYQIRSILIPYLIDFFNFSCIMYDIYLYDK